MPMLDVAVFVVTPLLAGRIGALDLLRNACHGLVRSVAPAFDCHHPSISNLLEVAYVHLCPGTDCVSAHNQKDAMCVIMFNCMNLAVEVLNLP